MTRDIDVASLMMKHFEVEFVFDDQGRILSANYWTEAKTAKFLLGITRSRAIWAFSSELPKHVCLELEKIAKLEDFDPADSPKHIDRYQAVLSENMLSSQLELYDSLTYWFADDEPGDQVNGCVRITEDNQSLLSEHFEHMLGYDGKVIKFDQPIIAQVVDGTAVAVCSSARSNREAHECYVLTVPDYRNQGFATNVVRSWANQLVREDILPLYNTSIDNIEAQTVAAKSGFSLYGRALRIH